ncbi:hypothetical protein ACFV3R_25510 [Streptomyces sp. NPDC059740]|uniref:hypothetical protein n=1 Tax=Streptomyces sp. NPDC059740 TaxID=3346926 RepID=UPI00364DD3B4
MTRPPQGIVEYRRRKLGDFIGCARPSCPQGEWTAKATGRGWVQRDGWWYCPAHKPQATR